MKAIIHVTLKNGVLDPQGKAINTTLNNMGFDMVQEVRQGKYIELELKGQDAKTAEANVREMCDKLLANTVIENYRIEIAA